MYNDASDNTNADRGFVATISINVGPGAVLSAYGDGLGKIQDYINKSIKESFNRLDKSLLVAASLKVGAVKFLFKNGSTIIQLAVAFKSKDPNKIMKEIFATTLGAVITPMGAWGGKIIGTRLGPWVGGTVAGFAGPEAIPLGVAAGIAGGPVAGKYLGAATANYTGHKTGEFIWDYFFDHSSKSDKSILTYDGFFSGYHPISVNINKDVAINPGNYVTNYEDKYIKYIIGSGDTWGGIAKRFNVKMTDLLINNKNMAWYDDEHGMCVPKKPLSSFAVGDQIIIPKLYNDVTNDFVLKVDNTGNRKDNGAFDSEKNTHSISEGLLSAGGSWLISQDPNILNYDHRSANSVDNVATVARGNLLSDDFRPGNMNLATPVFDIKSNLWHPSPELMEGTSSARPRSWIEHYIQLNSLNNLGKRTFPTDPLLLDLNGDGVKLTDYRTDAVLFDVDNDGGSLEETGWISPEDGILVQDLNGNGVIDNISETFSEYFAGAVGKNGESGEKRFANGFAALASLDFNHDGVFDHKDKDWNKLRVWQDKNHDGVSSADELFTLDSLNITAIYLANNATSGKELDGNEVLAEGHFVRNGSSYQALAARFIANPLGHSFTTVAGGVKVQTQGDDRVAPVTGFVSTDNSGQVLNAAALGVSTITGGDGNDTLIADDSKNNWLAGGAGSDTFYGGAGDDVLLIDADDLPENIHGGAGTDIVQVVGSRGVYLDLTKAEVEVAQGGTGNDIFIATGSSTVYLRGGAGDDVLMGGDANDVLAGEEGDDRLFGGAGNDILRGHQGKDQLYGGDGDDLLDGGSGDDVLFGDDGDDVLIGGSGDDFIDGGEGIDVIQMRGNFADYTITAINGGFLISDRVAGRDGTDLVYGVEKANFHDINLIDMPNGDQPGAENPFPVKDVLTVDKNGQQFDGKHSYIIGSKQLLANDIDLQDDPLHITELSDVVGGRAVLTNEGDILFTPDPKFTGLTSFKYTISDSHNNPAMTVVENSSGAQAVTRAQVFLQRPDLPDDPGLTNQYYLAQTNVLPVWQHYTGKGVKIGQFEPGSDFAIGKEILDYRHPDIQPNIDAKWLANLDPNDTLHVSNHATMVAGVMVAARNGVGGVGVAYDAKLGGHWIDAKDFSSMDKMQEYDVVNNSWGSNIPFDLKFTPATIGRLPGSYTQALANGRHGLGTVIVSSAGNDRQHGGNANYNNVSNSRSSVIVGATNVDNDLSILQVPNKPFSSPGASILVSAPGNQIETTAHQVINQNDSVLGNESMVAQGTSFAGPTVAGIVALMLEANPQLGYRDVKQILALSAKKVEDANTQWQDNGSHEWNGGGMHVSHDYGYGMVDAQAAVRLAENWSSQNTFFNEYSLLSTWQSAALEARLPDASPSAAGVYSNSMRVETGDINIETVEVKVNLTHAHPGDLTLELISPSGTKSVLMDRPGKSLENVSGISDFAGSDTLNYVFSSERLRGEKAPGTWTLRVIDNATGNTGVLHDWSMNVFGSANTRNNQYVYTDEYIGSGSRSTLHDTNGGADIINVAAINGASNINLLTGHADLNGQSLTIIEPDNIEYLIGGDYADTLQGNNNNNILVGGRGDDMLIGNGGDDILMGGLGNNTLSGGSGNDVFVIDKEKNAQTVITDFSVATDRLVLSDFAVLSGLSLSQQGNDALLSLDDGQTIRLNNIKPGTFGLNNLIISDKKISIAGLLKLSMAKFGANTPEQTVMPDSYGNSFWADARGNRVFGGRYGDIIYGGSGNDVLIGDNSTDGTVGGDDVIYGGAGNDVVRGGPGNDTLYGGAGLDYLGGDGGNDTLYLEGDEGAAALNGITIIGNINTGEIPLTGAAVSGGEGDDRFVLVNEPLMNNGSGLLKNIIEDFEVSNSQEKIDLSQFDNVHAFDDLRFSTVTAGSKKYLRVWIGTPGAETAYITLPGITQQQLSASNFIFNATSNALASAINGNWWDDHLYGNAGGNVLDGKSGADVMEGRTGDDTYIVDNVNDKVIELTDGGYDTIKSSVSYTLPDNVEELQLTGHEAINGTGNALNNRITGNDANNILDGVAGINTLAGGKGDDTYRVHNTLDKVIEKIDAGYDQVYSSVSFTLPDNVEDLTLTGEDTINGTGNDMDNHITGNDANNRLIGGKGNDYLAGMGGNDFLYGGDGDDTLVGGKGNDILEGGAGNDHYVFKAGDGTDVIFDLSGDHDTLNFDVDFRSLWFGYHDNDLTVGIIGTEDQLRIAGWNDKDAAGHYLHRIETITAEGHTLDHLHVDNLVNAMAAFAPPAMGQMVLPDDYQRTLSPVMAANWQ